jgi:hypothetical protein
MWAHSVIELTVASDYGAMFVYDAEDFVNRHLDQLAPDGGEDVMTRAMEDGTESRRFVGYDDGFVVIQPPSQYNFDAPLRVEVGEGPPPDDRARWDHVVEVPLELPSGRLVFEASGGGPATETAVRPNTYRARISGRDLIAGVGEIEGHESWRVQLWPASRSEPTLVKYWAGYDVMAPAHG